MFPSDQQEQGSQCAKEACFRSLKHWVIAFLPSLILKALGVSFLETQLRQRVGRPGVGGACGANMVDERG